MLYEMARRNKEKVFCRMPFWHADRILFMNSQLKTKDKTSHGHGAGSTRIVEYRNRFTIARTGRGMGVSAFLLADYSRIWYNKKHKIH